MPSNKFEQLSYAGAVLLIIGAFTPMVALPVGSVSYYDAQNPGVFILIAFAIAGPALIFLNKQPLAFISAAGIWVTLLFPVLKDLFKTENKSVLGDLTKKATDPLKELGGNIFLDVVNFDWGGYVFLLGLIGLSVGTIMVTVKARK